MKNITKKLKQPITWGGYMKFSGICAIISLIGILIFAISTLTDIPAKCSGKFKSLMDKIHLRKN